MSQRESFQSRVDAINQLEKKGQSKAGGVGTLNDQELEDLKVNPDRFLRGRNDKSKTTPLRKVHNTIVVRDLMKGGQKTLQTINTFAASPKTGMTLDLDSPTKPAKPRYSYLQQRVIFIPKDIEVLSASNGRTPGFTSFEELARTTKNSHAEAFESVLSQNVDLRITEHKNTTPNTASSNQFNVINKILKLNEMQKSHYNEHFMDHEQKVMAMTMQEFQKKTPTSTKMPRIKVSPSRRLIANLHQYVDHGNEQNSAEHGYNEKRQEYDGYKEKDGDPYVSFNSLDGHGHGTSSKPKNNNVSGNLKFFWHFCNEERGQWRPGPRESASFTAIGNLLVLYGGIRDKSISTINIYNPVKDTWLSPEVKGDIPFSGRHSHTACEYQGKVVIFGGEYGYSAVMHIRECRNDTYIFHPENYEWEAVKPHGPMISVRRNHTAVIHDKGMYVYGGINTEGEYLSDLWALNLKSYRWFPLDAKKDKQPGQAFHTMCACFDKSPSQTSQKKNQGFEEGLYVFGGRDGDGAVLDTLKYLPLSSEVLEWKYPTIKGPTPPARYDHIMLFYEPLKVLLIHGGRNQHSFKTLNNAYLDDIRVLHLETMTWGVSVLIGNICTIGRSRHSATLIGNTIAIFGGMGYSEYANPDVKLVEANQLNVWRLTKDYEAKAKKQGNIIRKAEILAQEAEEAKAKAQAQALKTPDTDLSEVLDGNQAGANKKPDTANFGTVKGSHKLMGNIRNMIGTNGFGQTMKTLNKIEGERLKLKKLSFM